MVIELFQELVGIKGKGLLIGIIIILAIGGIVFFQNAFATELEEEIADAVGEGIGDLVDRLGEDIDFSDDNFLNTNEEETRLVLESGKEVMIDMFDIFISMKDFSKYVVQWISPYEISDFLLTLIGIAFAVIFVLAILKKIGLHIVIMVGVGLAIVLIFVVLNIQT